METARFYLWVTKWQVSVEVEPAVAKPHVKGNYGGAEKSCFRGSAFRRGREGGPGFLFSISSS